MPIRRLEAVCLQPIRWYDDAAGFAPIQSAENLGGRGSLSCAEHYTVYGVWIVLWGTEYYLHACCVLVMYLYLCGMHLLGEARTGTHSVYIWQTGEPVLRLRIFTKTRWRYTLTCLVEVSTWIREIFHNTWRRAYYLLAISVFTQSVVRTFSEYCKNFHKISLSPLVA